MKSFFHRLALLALSLAGSCNYGPKTEAKVASAVQTLMASLIEGSLSSLGGGGGAAVDCGVSGTFTAENATFGTIDPLNPTDTMVSTPITFDHCVIKVCGETYALHGGGTSINLTFGDLSGMEGATTNTTSIDVTVVDQVFEAGFLTGTLSFGYNMTATVGNSTLQSVNINDKDPADPLVYESKTYNGAELDALADGC